MSAVYAKISSGTVIDIVIANPGDVFDAAFAWTDVTAYNPRPQIGWTTGDNTTFTKPGMPDDAYGNTVTFSTDGINDTYTAANYPAVVVAHGTPQAAAYLKMAIQENLLLAQDAAINFTCSRYSIEVRDSLRNIYTLAVLNGLTNRAAYCLQLMTWGQSIASYMATYMVTIKAQNNPATVASLVPDFSSFVGTDPLVTPVGALAISN